MRKLHDIELMEHVDGERDHSDQLRDPLARETNDDKIKALGELSELVRGHLELSADAVPAARFEQIWDAVDTSIASRPASVWSRVGSWFERYRGHVITGVVSAGAVAALALVLRGPSSGTTTTASGVHGSPNVVPVAYRPTEIESLDTPGGDSTVFNLQDEDGPATVIWVTPEDTVGGI